MNLKNLFVISSILSLLNVAQGAFQIKEESKKYIDALETLKEEAQIRNTAIMCSEKKLVCLGFFFLSIGP